MSDHGEIAIILVHTNTVFECASDVIRLVFSSCLLLFSIFALCYAVNDESTLMEDSIQPLFVYLLLILSLISLGILEGTQIAVVELAHRDPELLREHYPRAAKLLTIENKGRNVERYLIGRQILVVGLVFIAARITSYNSFAVDVPYFITHGVMHYGFLGVILIVIVAQLTPQILAAAYPVEFLNLPGMKYAFYLCLLVESTGIAHAVWLLCWLIKTGMHSILCKWHHTIQIHQKEEKDADYDNVPPTTTDSNEEKIELQNMSKISLVVEQKISHTSVDITSTHTQAMIGEDCEGDLRNLSKFLHARPDLFYKFGDAKYPSPREFYDKFADNGVPIPSFLLPTDDERHVPPHIIAMTLLRLYSARTVPEQEQHNI